MLAFHNLHAMHVYDGLSWFCYAQTRNELFARYSYLCGRSLKIARHVNEVNKYSCRDPCSQLFS